MSLSGSNSPRPIEAPALTIEGFEVSSPSQFTPSPRARKASLLSLCISSTPVTSEHYWSQDSNSEAYSDYSDNEDEEAGLPIHIR